jgi:hypothetical protein
VYRGAVVKWISDKSASDIRFHWSRIKDGCFDQDTLASLLVAVRQRAAKGGPTREIGDFIAHPSRDRGILLEHFESVKLMVDGTESNRITIGTTKQLHLSIPQPLSPAVFIDDLGETLIKLQVDEPRHIINALAVEKDELTLCYLGILHHATLRVNRKSDVVLKATCFVALDGVAETKLTLRGFRGGTMLLIMTTNLEAADWCDQIPLSSIELPNLRATRREDGLKLRAH